MTTVSGVPEATMMKRKWTSTSRVSVLGAALGMIGAIMWSGCGGPSDGSYYCDDSGCYSCDGYSCRDVPTPPTQPCTGDQSCGGGSICTDVGCVQTCSANADCAKGTVCKSGQCVAPSSQPSNPKGCTTTTDCAAGNVCTGGKCVPGPVTDAGPDGSKPDAGPTCGGSSGPCACTSPAQCAAGQVCVEGACTAASNACKYSSECSPGDVCANGRCVDDCSIVSCSTGFTCVKGACEPVPTGAACTTDATCPAGAPHCVSGECVAQCTGDAQCKTGEYCNQGACQLDTRPRPKCTGPNDCSTAQQCIQGYCRYSCTSSDVCMHIDTRIGVCGGDGVCWSSAEANPQCTTKSDCKSGQDCIGNVCK